MKFTGTRERMCLLMGWLMAGKQLTVKNIVDMLLLRGIETERKAIYQDLAVMSIYFPIQKRRMSHNQTVWYWGEWGKWED